MLANHYKYQNTVEKISFYTWKKGFLDYLDIIRNKNKVTKMRQDEIFDQKNWPKKDLSKNSTDQSYFSMEDGT